MADHESQNSKMNNNNNNNNNLLLYFIIAYVCFLFKNANLEGTFGVACPHKIYWPFFNRKGMTKIINNIQIKILWDLLWSLYYSLIQVSHVGGTFQQRPLGYYGLCGLWYGVSVKGEVPWCSMGAWPKHSSVNVYTFFYSLEELMIIIEKGEHLWDLPSSHLTILIVV